MLHSTWPSFVTITSPSERAVQNTHQDKGTATVTFKLHFFFFFAPPATTPAISCGWWNEVDDGLSEGPRFVLGRTTARVLLTHWTVKIKNTIIFPHQVFPGRRWQSRCRVCHLQTLEKSPGSLTLLDSQTLSLRVNMIESIHCSFMRLRPYEWLDNVCFSQLQTHTGCSACAVGIFLFFQIIICVMPMLCFKPCAHSLTSLRSFYGKVNNSSVHLWNPSLRHRSELKVELLKIKLLKPPSILKKIIQRSTKVVIQIVAQRSCGD